ncbi:MAG TPA: outer membrane lipoprotein chaperone LolA [Leucothrix mucor]|nr:outer membrane lipoprotein chaperone LolA [Leucothrix mucor]
MKKTSIKTFTTTFLAGALLVGVSHFATAATDDARQRLNNFFTKVNTIKGSFTQQVFDKKGKRIQQATGQIYLNRPGKFRWVYATPDPQEIIADGKNIWIYDKDLEQVTVKPMTAAMSSAPIAILTRKTIPDSQFKVTKMDMTIEGLDWFDLKPHRKSRDFKSMQLGLDKNGIRKMIMFDQLGQKTVINLNVRNNAPISGNRFIFRPPANVDVIGTPL